MMHFAAQKVKCFPHIAGISTDKLGVYFGSGENMKRILLLQPRRWHNCEREIYFYFAAIIIEFDVFVLFLMISLVNGSIRLASNVVNNSYLCYIVSILPT